MKLSMELGGRFAAFLENELRGSLYHMEQHQVRNQLCVIRVVG